MDEQKKKSQKKRSVIPIYAIGAVWLLYAGKLDTFRGIVSCAVVSAIVYGILRIVLRGKKTDTPEEAPAAAPEPQPAKSEPQPQPEADKLRLSCSRSSTRARPPSPRSASSTTRSPTSA